MTTRHAPSLRAILIIAATLGTLCGCKQRTQVAVHAMTELRPQSTFTVKGHPDWMAIAPDSVWVTSSADNIVSQLKASDNQLGTTVPVSQPCSGLAVGFGSIWIPSCGQHTLIRADLTTGKIQATIPIGPANSEGGITVGAGSIWLMTNAAGVLARIDPMSN